MTNQLIILLALFIIIIFILIIVFQKHTLTHHVIEDKIQDFLENIKSKVNNIGFKPFDILGKIFHNPKKEGLQNKHQRENYKISCLGDSVFQNKDYVGINESVEDMLADIATKNNSLSLILAQDNAQIKSVYSQIKILQDQKNWNGENNYIFLSVGGNDIVNNFYPISNNHKNYIASTLVSHKREEINKIFRKYIELVEKLREDFPESKIVLSTVYYPKDDQYTKFHNVIKYWNQSVIDYSKLYPKNVYKVLRTDKLVKEPEDFTHFIEPSALGGEKIVEGIKKIVF